MKENRHPPTFRAGLRVRVFLTVCEQRERVLQGAWRLQAIDVAQADEEEVRIIGPVEIYSSERSVLNETNEPQSRRIRRSP